MDPNLLQATLSGYFASARRQDRCSLRLERETVACQSADRGAHRSWMTAMRVRIGAGFIFLGERIGQKPVSEPADTAATP